MATQQSGRMARILGALRERDIDLDRDTSEAELLDALDDFLAEDLEGDGGRDEAEEARPRGSAGSPTRTSP